MRDFLFKGKTEDFVLETKTISLHEVFQQVMSGLALMHPVHVSDFTDG